MLYLMPAIAGQQVHRFGTVTNQMAMLSLTACCYARQSASELWLCMPGLTQAWALLRLCIEISDRDNRCDHVLHRS